jgi:hypothetical protein
MTGSYLWILLYSLHRLFLCLPFSRSILCLNRLVLLLFNLTSILTPLIVLVCLGADIQALAILTHGKIRLCFSEIRTYELWVSLDSLVAILHRGWETQQLDEAGSAVGVAAGIFWCALDHFAIRLHGTWPICFFELLVPQFTSFFCFGWVDIGVLLRADLGLFSGTEFCQYLWSAVFGEGGLVVGDGGSQVAQLFVCSANATKSSAANLLEYSRI